MIIRYINQKGYSLIELVIALILLSVILLGFAGSYNSLSLSTRAMEQNATALALLKSRIEIFCQSETYSSVTPPASGPTVAPYSTTGINGINYTVTITQAAIPAAVTTINPQPTTFPYTAQVTWRMDNKASLPLNTISTTFYWNAGE